MFRSSPNPYKSLQLDVAFLRGTTADPEGNITMEREALTLEALAVATAVHNAGGLVIVQVERVSESGSWSSRAVKIPGILVDCVVVSRPGHQLRDYKRRAAAAAPEIKGRFDWLRRDIAIFSGGMLYIENDFDVVVNGRPVLWFDRDDEGYALLNVRMPQASSSKRVAIEDNSWVSVGNPVRSPPGGKSLEVRYRNGDYLSVRFAAADDEPTFQETFEAHGNLTFVEVVMRVPDIGLDLRTDGFRGGPKITGAVVLRQNHIGLALDIGPTRPGTRRR